MKHKRSQWIDFVVGPASEKGKAEDKKARFGEQAGSGFFTLRVVYTLLHQR